MRVDPARQDEALPPAITDTPRRFCAQQASVDSEQMGRSLP
jgi:hypothetical protein